MQSQLISHANLLFVVVVVPSPKCKSPKLVVALVFVHEQGATKSTPLTHVQFRKRNIYKQLAKLFLLPFILHHVLHCGE